MQYIENYGLYFNIYNKVGMTLKLYPKNNLIIMHFIIFNLISSLEDSISFIYFICRVKISFNNNRNSKIEHFIYLFIIAIILTL